MSVEHCDRHGHYDTDDYITCPQCPDQLEHTMMTRVEVNNLLVRVVEAKAQLAIMQQHYDDLYHQFWHEIQQHYPIQPR